MVLAPTAVMVAPAGIPGPLIGMPTHIDCGLATLEMLLLPDVTVPVGCAVMALNSVANVVRDTAALLAAKYPLGGDIVANNSTFPGWLSKLIA